MNVLLSERPTAAEIAAARLARYLNSVSYSLELEAQAERETAAIAAADALARYWQTASYSHAANIAALIAR